MRARGAIALAAIVWVALGGTAQAEDLVVRSFDGTPIVAHWFPNPSLGPGERAPVVLNGPGWSSPGEKDPSRGAIKRLHDLGYNVLTWDPRGFGVSGREATINAPQVEGRDVRALISVMARRPEVRLDRRGDPRVGMTGGSYGGGIQFSTASIDRRIDAIVPTIAWNSLETSLYKDRTFKQGWNDLLYSAGRTAAERGGLAGGPAGVQTGGLDPHIISAYESATRTGVLSDEDVAWFRRRGPGDAGIRRITAPTMIVSGTVDTLFPVDEGVRNYGILKARGVPVKLFWFCGGHGTCAEGNGGEPGASLDLDSVIRSGAVDPRLEDATARWLARWLKGDRSVRTGPGFEFRSDDRRYRGAPQYPVAPAEPLRAQSSGRLRMAPDLTSGGDFAAFPAESDALEVRLVVRRRAQLLGPPRVSIRYRGTGAPAGTRVFAQLVNADRGVVVGNQAVPIPVRLDGRRRSVSRPLVPVASSAPAGTRYVLQLVAGTKVWARQRTTGVLNASSVRVEVPVASPRGLGPRGVRCQDERTARFRLRGSVAAGRVLLDGRVIGRVSPGSRTVSVRLDRRALGEQRLRLVLRRPSGRASVVKRTVWLCGAA